MILIDEPEEDWGGEIFGTQRTGDQRSNNIENGGLAAAAFGGGQVEAGRLDEGREDVGMGAPKCEGIGRTGRERGVKGEAVRDVMEQLSGIDNGFGPGLDGFERGEGGFEIGSEARC
jgi:hypothetical protein